MRTERIFAPRQEVFDAAKTTCVVPHAGGLLHDALVQCSLDPAVFEISFLREAGPPSAEVELNVVTVLRRDGPFYLDIVPAMPLRSPAEHDRFGFAVAALGLKPLTMSGRDILQEPRFSSARAVWSQRRFNVRTDMRLRLLSALADEAHLTLDSLCRMVPGPEDPLASVLAMACADEVELDLLSGPLGGATKVSARE